MINRNTLKVLIVSLLWSMGFSFSWIFIGVYIYQLSSDLLLSTLFYSVPQTAWIIGSIIWGVLSDVKFRRKMILGGSSILFGLLLLPFIFTQNPLILILFFTAAYFFAAGRNASLNAYITIVEKERGKALSWVIMAGSTGWFMGSLVSGFIYENLNPIILFLFASLFIITAGITAFTLKEAKRDKVHSSVSHFRVYLNLFKKPIIAVVCVAGLVIYVSQNLVSSMFSVYFVNGLGGTPTLYSIASAAAAGFGILASFALGHLSEKKYFGRAGAILYSIIGYIIFYSLVLTKNLAIVAIGWALPFYAGIMIGGPAFVSDHTEEANRSRGMALFDMFASVGTTFGYIFASLIIYSLMLTNIIQAMTLLTELAIAITVITLVFFVAGLVILNKRRETIFKKRTNSFES